MRCFVIIKGPCSIDGSRGRKSHRNLQLVLSMLILSSRKLHWVSPQLNHSRIMIVLLDVKALQAQRVGYLRRRYQTMPTAL